MQVFKSHPVVIADVDAAAKQKRPAGAIWEIGPDVAEHLLKTYNVKNRQKKSANVKAMALAMRNGDWRMTMDSLKFGDDATLKDGQNRLTACVKAQVPFTTLVVFGVPSDAFDAMDTGIRRTVSDIFKLDGVTNYVSMSSAAVWLAFLLDGDPLKDRRSRTPLELLNRFKTEWQGLDLSYTKDVKTVSRMGHPVGLLIAMHYLFSRSNPRKADAFFQSWATGIFHSKVDKDPVRMLSEALVKRMQTLGRLHDRDRPLLMALAWNAFVKGGALPANKLDVGAKTPGIGWPGIA